MPTRANEEYVKGFEDSPEMMMKMKPTAAAAAAAAVHVVPVSNEYAMIALCVFVSRFSSYCYFCSSCCCCCCSHALVFATAALSSLYTYSQVFCVISNIYYQPIK